MATSIRVSWTAPNELQWGRDLTDADGLYLIRTAEAKAELQWGRDLTDADGSTCRCGADVASGRFNGAAT